MAFLLKATQQVDLTLEVTDKRGNPTAVQNATWSSSDPSVLGVAAGPDGMTATAVAAGPAGTAVVTVDGDADLGDGVSPISGAADFQVVAGDAAIINLVPGLPVEQGGATPPPPDGGTTPPPDGGTLPPDGGATPPPDGGGGTVSG
jgi:hypothetical protein